MVLETEATSQKPSYAEVTKPQEIELPEQVGHLNKLAVMRQIEKMSTAKSYLGANCTNQGGMDRLDQLKASHTFAMSQIKLDQIPAHLLASTPSDTEHKLTKELTPETEAEDELNNLDTDTSAYEDYNDET